MERNKNWPRNNYKLLNTYGNQTFPQTQNPRPSTSQTSMRWETEGGTHDAVFRNMKWKLTHETHECNQLISFLLSQMGDRRYIGLDAEWDPVFSKGQTSRTALIQLAVHSGYCILVRVYNMRSLPPLLEELLTDPSIHKIGVGIRDDVVKIFKDFKVLTLGHFDLREIAPPAAKLGLNALAADHLGVTLCKSKALRMSKWSRHLTAAKRAYAAKDAYVATLLLPKLVALKLKIPLDCVSPNDILTVVKAKCKADTQQVKIGKKRKKQKTLKGTEIKEDT